MGELRHYDTLPTTVLSPREREVLLAYARLGSYRAVAEALCIARSTVRDHLVHARHKLGADSTVQAVWLLDHPA